MKTSEKILTFSAIFISCLEYNYKDTIFNSLPKLVTHLARLKAINDKRTNEPIAVNFTFAEIIKGRVIKPAESIKIYTALDSFTISLGWDYLYDVKTRIDYCSIYEDCWSMQEEETVALD